MAAVYDSTQIKSATDNRGTFDAGNADITFSVSPTLREDVEAAYEHRLKADDIMPLCTAPRAFAALGLPMLDIVTTPNIIGKVKNKHHMNIDEVEKAVYGMDDPLLIIREDDGRIILFPGGMAWSKNGEGDIVAPVRLELSQDKSHFMTTLYGLDNLQKTETLLRRGFLLYSKYEKAELATSNAPGLSPDLMRLVTEHGFTDNTITRADIVKRGGKDFSASLRFLPEATVQHAGLTAPVSVWGYAAFVQQIERDMEDALGRFRTLGAKAESRRERALVAVGTAYNLAKATAAYLPKGYRFSIRPYLNRLQVSAEQGKADEDNKLLELEAEYNLLSTFGNWRDMSLEQAIEAYENLQQRITLNRWAEGGANRDARQVFLRFDRG